MTPNSNWLYVIVPVLGFVFIAFVGKRAGWFRIISGTNALLRQNITALETRNALLQQQLDQEKTQHEKETAEWHEKFTANIKEIGAMQGQIDVLKSIPLVNIDATLKEISRFNKSLAKSNAEILKLTRAKAQIDAEDRDTLTNQNKHIRDEFNKMKKEK